jgi:hypothetical protein
MSPTRLITLCLVALLLPNVLAMITEKTSTTARQVSANWWKCTGCQCEQHYLSAYEQDMRTGIGKNQQISPSYWLYYYHYYYDMCLYTWNTEWAQTTVPLKNFTVSQNGRSATLFGTNILDNENHNITIDMRWEDVDLIGSCLCKQEDSTGPVSFKQTSKSSYSQTDVFGYIKIDTNVYNSADIGSGVGWVYDYGNKVISWTHP